LASARNPYRTREAVGVLTEEFAFLIHFGYQDRLTVQPRADAA
jgi:hypothetical protein